SPAASVVISTSNPPRSKPTVRTTLRIANSFSPGRGVRWVFSPPYCHSPNVVIVYTPRVSLAGTRERQSMRGGGDEQGPRSRFRGIADPDTRFPELALPEGVARFLRLHPDLRGGAGYRTGVRPGLPGGR